MKYILIIILLLLTSCEHRKNDNLMPLTGDAQVDYGIMQLNLERSK